MTMAGMDSPGRDDPARRSDAVDVQALPNDPAKPKSSFPAISTDVYKSGS
jgi:hypothetical protein